MEFLTTTIQYGIHNFGPLGVFFASVLEEVVSPIPSSLVQLFSGSFIMTGYSLSPLGILILLLKVSIPSALGVTIGSLPYFWISRKFGLSIINKWGKWIGVSISDIDDLKSRFEKTKLDEVMFVLMRAFPLVPSIALAIYGGVTKMSWWSYSVLSFIGVFIRATVLGFVGWIFINTFNQVSSGIDQMEKIGLLVMLILIGSVLFFLKKKK